MVLEMLREAMTWVPTPARRLSRRDSDRVMSFWWEESRVDRRDVRADSRVWRAERAARISEVVVAEGEAKTEVGSAEVRAGEVLVVMVDGVDPAAIAVLLRRLRLPVAAGVEAMLLLMFLLDDEDTEDNVVLRAAPLERTDIGVAVGEAAAHCGLLAIPGLTK